MHATRWKAIGRDPADLAGLYMLDVVVDDSEDATLAIAADHYRTSYSREQLTSMNVKRHGLSAPPSGIPERIAAYDSTGVEWFVLRFMRDNPLEQLRRFADWLS